MISTTWRCSLLWQILIFGGAFEQKRERGKHEGSFFFFHVYLMSKRLVSQACSCCCCCVPLPTGTHLGPYHEPVRSDSDGDYRSLATLLSVAITAFAKHNYTRPLVVVEDEDSRRLRHVLDARYRQERGARQPFSRQAHTACFPSPHLQSFVCVR